MSGLDNALDNLVGKWSGELLSVLRIVSAYMYMLHRTVRSAEFECRDASTILDAWWKAHSRRLKKAAE